MDRQMTYATRTVIALLSLALTLSAARAAEPVDLLLVLAADVSRSVTEGKFRLQREGAAAAISIEVVRPSPRPEPAHCRVFFEWATTASGVWSTGH